MKLYIGIDPGAAGGVCVIDEGGDIRLIANMAKITEPELVRHLSEIAPHVAIATLEKVGAMPKQGLSSTFKFGRNVGMMEGLLMGVGIPYEMVTPQTWQKSLGVSRTDPSQAKTAHKRSLKEAAQRFFPKFVKHITNNTADAVLMAEFCRRRHALPTGGGNG